MWFLCMHDEFISIQANYKLIEAGLAELKNSFSEQAIDKHIADIARVLPNWKIDEMHRGQSFEISYQIESFFEKKFFEILYLLFRMNIN